ncbi:SusC/RagA family TonB-linked outer membrane protein [Dysgonomonas sp. BGC7]|nr:SusC/RagA family TonB-linked outer membrane protein [Dysgonomonas sp. BGC7]
MKLRTLYILLFLLMGTVAFAQEMRVVSGVIKDSSDEPIIGVTVVQKGTTNGTVTNLDGYYEIKAPLGSTLLFSFIGMKPSEMKVTTSNSKPTGGSVPSAILPIQVTAPIAVSETPEAETKSDEDKVKPKEVQPSREDQSLSPYFLIRSNSPKESEMPLKNTEVEVSIAGVIADICVKQIYINQSKNTLEAVYVFPGSTRAAVYGMAMTVGNRRIDAKIKKKEQARKEYEQAKSEGRSTTLLEQHRPNVFQMNVANILPGDTIVVEMKYTELLEHEKGIYEFVYPTVVGPRYSESGEQWVDKTIDMFFNQNMPQFSIKTTVQAGMPIQKISSPSHSLTIESPSADQAIVSLSNPEDNQGNKDYILQYELQGGKVESGLLRYEHGDENFFLLMMQPPKKPTLDQIPPREYVFIVDVSGSMHGFPLDVSKRLIRNLISSLRPTDKFNVMLFESSNQMLYDKSVAATENNIDKAIKVINQQKGSGSTQLYAAVKNAMNFNETEGFSRTFIIVTDGFVTVEKEAFNYIRENLNKANLFPFGIGTSVNRYMIEGLANAGMGTPYIVTNHTQAEAIGKKAIKEISEPVLTNISIDWGYFDVYDVEPVAIPDVFSERPMLVYGKYKLPADGTITVSGIAGNLRYEQKFDVDKARVENNQALRYLWARNQIRYIDDYAQYYEGSINGWRDIYGNHTRTTSQIERVTNLGLKYNLLTQYTSFLAVDDVVRNVPEYKKSTPSYSSSSTPQTVTSPNIQLSENQANLEEVVVVGYGTTRRDGLTSSTSSISGNEISGSVSHVLQGRVAGLQITQTSGEPGSPARVRIRGASSIIDNNTPLVILDGAPIEYNDFSRINSNDIESITIQKDASAAAIYGSKAANGVLIVTTKNPKHQKHSISYSSSFSIDNPNKLPKKQSEYTQGRPVNGTPVWNKENESFSWGPSVSSVNAPTYNAFDILETGYTIKNHLTLTRRNDDIHYTLKLGNNTQQGFIPKSKLNETSFGLKVGGQWSKKLKFDIDLNYKNTNGKRLQHGYNMSGFMQGILLSPPTFDNRKTTLADGSQNTAGTASDNPYWTTENNPFKDETNRFVGNANFSYKLFDYLTLGYAINGEYMTGEASTALNKSSIYIPTGHIMNRDEKFKALQPKFTVQFDKNFDNIGVNAMVGHEYNNTKRTIDRIDGYDLVKAGDYNIINAITINPYNQSFRRHSNAVFGKAAANYLRKFMLEAAMRSEWSSISDKTLFSPSLGIATNLHEMFYSELFSNIKISANISKADKEIPLYVDPVYFNSAIYNLNDGTQHFESREIIVSDDLKPENIVNYSIGAEIGMWNNRVSLSGSIYWKKAKDQLLPVQVSPTAIRFDNYGSFKAHGLEIELSAYIINNKNFKWNSRLIFSRERNKITNLEGKNLMLAGIENAAGSYAIEGQPLGVIYGTAYKRDAQRRMIIGSDGFPVVNEELQILGDPNPDWQLGWAHSIEYRRLSLSLLFDFKNGGKMWNGTKNMMNYYGTSQYSADHRNTTNYIFPGVFANGQENNIPVNFYGNNLDENRWVRYGRYGVGEDAIENASYIKLREITLSYRIPLRISNRQTWLKTSVYATNILLYSKYKGIDPETNLTGSSNGFGLDYFNVPGTRSIGMSLNWEF